MTGQKEIYRMTVQEINQINTSTLAYLGDAIYEVAIREMVIARQPNDAGKAHKLAVKYVSAEGQAHAAKSMMSDGFLTDEEERLLKRARNHRMMSKPTNADPRNYKVATGFEALIAYLYLKEDNDRLHKVVAEAVRIIDEA